MNMSSLVFAASLLLPSTIWAKAIGYDLRDEKQDGQTKVYSVSYEVWSEDAEAKELRAVPSSESANIKVLSKAKTWRNVPKGQHQKIEIAARNASHETGTLVLEIIRKSADRTDRQKISIQVAPQ